MLQSFIVFKRNVSKCNLTPTVSSKLLCYSVILTHNVGDAMYITDTSGG